MMEPLVAPLPPDCEAHRLALLDLDLPPLWRLDAQTARALHDEGSARSSAAWQPALDTLPVEAEDVVIDGLPAMRAYRPTDAAADVTLAWLHGGGWVLGGLDASDATCRTICHLTGWEVVSIDYRCAPSHVFPAAVDDSVAAVDWLAGSRRRLAVGGDSAGANLSAVAVRERRHRPPLAGQLLVYPATDPRLRSQSAEEFVDGPFLTRRDMEWFYDQYLPEDHRDDRRADLSGDVGAGPSVPAVVVTVGHDPLRDEGIEYARALAAAGGAVDWIHAPELFHGALTQAGILPSAMARLEQACAAAVRLFI